MDCSSRVLPIHAHRIIVDFFSSLRTHYTMVSFSCEVCNDTVIKKKLDMHSQRCHGAYFTCIDCSTTFSGTEYRGHTQCISEAEKYEKALYKGNQKKPESSQKPVVKESKPITAPAAKVTKPTKDQKKVTKKDALDIKMYAGDSLYKIVKKLSKDMKADKKDVLKKLKLEIVDGQPVLQL